MAYGYVHYWWKNSGIDASRYSDIDSIYRKHIRDFRRKAKESVGVKTTKELDEVLSDFKKLETKSGSKDIFKEAWDEGTRSPVQLFFESLLDNIHEVKGMLNKVSKTVDGVGEFCDTLKTIEDMLFSQGDGKLYTEAMKKVVVEYAGKKYSEIPDTAREAFEKELAKVTDGSMIDLSSFAKESFNFAKLYNDFKNEVFALERERDKVSSLSSSGEKPGKSTSSRIEAIEEAIFQTLQDMKGPIGELSVAIGLANVIYEGLDGCRIENVIMTGHATSDFTLTYKNSDKLIKDLKEAGLMKDTSGAVSKADVVVQYSKNGVVLNVGLNVKNYTGYAKSTYKNYGGSIHLQDSTNMLTFLVRDIGYSGKELTDVYNLLGGRPKGPKKTDDLSVEKAQAFKQFKEYLAARALLTALTGFKMGAKKTGGTGQGSVFVVMRHSLISIQDILESVYEASRSGIKNMTFVNFKGMSLNKFEKKNQELFVDDGPKKSRKEAAQERSRAASMEFGSILASIGVEVMLDKSIITGLMF